MSSVVSEEEDMVQILVDLVSQDDGRFTPWELGFIESMREKLELEYTLTEGQIEKIRQIYEQRA